MINVDLATYDTDKPAGYLKQYALEFADLFDKPIRLLEVGVQRGGSLQLFRDLFPAGQIAGLDLNPITVPDESGRIHVYQGYQQDIGVLDRLAAEVAPDGFDIIIDDASHVGQYTEATFWHLFPHHLKAGGIYVLDDWACGYWDHWADGHAYEGTAAFRGTQPAELEEDQASRLEMAKRGLRAVARPIAARVDRLPRAKASMTRAYMTAEGLTLRRRFPSHDYGMVGFVKQLVDACALDVLRAAPGEGLAHPPISLIASVRVTPSQVFIRKNA